MAIDLSQPALVFEPDPALGESGAAMIREIGLQVDVTAREEEGLTFAKDRDFCFALIRVSPTAPDPSMEIAAALRARSATTHLVLISNSWPAELLSRTMKLPGAVVLDAPADRMKFQHLIRRTVVTWSSKARQVAAPAPAPVAAPATPSGPTPAAPSGPLFPKLRGLAPDQPPPPPPPSKATVNRRRHKRFEADADRVEIYEKGWLPLPFGKSNKGRRLIDLSAGGACLGSTHYLDVGTRVQIRIRLEKSKDNIKVAANVSWCRPNGPEFIIGVVFVELTPDQSDQLKKIEGMFTAPGN